MLPFDKIYSQERPDSQNHKLQKDFRIEELKSFYPGQPFQDQWQDSMHSRLINEVEGAQVYRLLLKKDSYSIAFFIAARNNLIIETYFPLPSYFLHDVFHQSLINQQGKQDDYQLINQTAVYRWQKNKQKIITYAATCTITCFPIFLSIKNSEEVPKKSLIAP